MWKLRISGEHGDLLSLFLLLFWHVHILIPDSLRYRFHNIQNNEYIILMIRQQFYEGM